MKRMQERSSQTRGTMMSSCRSPSSSSPSSFLSSSLSLLLLLFLLPMSSCSTVVPCSRLQPGQFVCRPLAIDEDTQQPKGCNRETWMAPATCEVVPGLKCLETGNSSFVKDDFVQCKFTNGYRWDTAMLLSIFLGVFGVDRFYLGYPALGLFKLCTLGFFLLGHLADVILIATQRLGPADGSAYVIDYYGAGVDIVAMDEHTHIKPRDEWL